MLKVCNSCKHAKETSEYHPRHGTCKACNNTKKKAYYSANKLAISERNKKRYRENAHLYAVKNKTYRDANKHELSIKKKAWRSKNIDRVAQKDKLWRSRNKDKINAYFRERSRDPLFKLRNNLRSRLSQALKKRNLNKHSSLTEYLGCSMVELKTYLESKFLPGMTWANYGRHGWHIDHIKPLSSASSAKELCLLCHYTNLQPLWAEDNIAKGAKST